MRQDTNLREWISPQTEKKSVSCFVIIQQRWLSMKRVAFSKFFDYSKTKTEAELFSPQTEWIATRIFLAGAYYC